MTHEKSTKSKSPTKTKSKLANKKQLLQFGLGLSLGICIFAFAGAFIIIKHEQTYAGRAYPGIKVAHVPVTGQTATHITNYWSTRNRDFSDITFTFVEKTGYTATLSANQLNLGYDATTSALQALAIGRSGNFASDLYHKYRAWRHGITVTPIFRWDQVALEDFLTTLSQQIDIEPVNALFTFKSGRVSEFKPAHLGRRVNKEKLRQQFLDQLQIIASNQTPPQLISFSIPVEVVEPPIKTDQVNNLGIKELIASGSSSFKGSIAGRIHNVALAASRIHGVLIPPGKTFSFNDAVGDISAATGYKQAYVIKSGRTVLDDGGGVCQVSTTLFRAVLNAGLPITERHAHSYRVAYYEQGWKPGFDATVYAPSYDLKFTNDTANHILIQAHTDTTALTLVFELYGTKDGREISISPVRLWDARPAPPDLYQDDPTLPNGTVKQVDWANPGLKAAFDYKVTQNGKTIVEKTFSSNYIPWQAVYLRGTKV